MDDIIPIDADGEEEEPKSAVAESPLLPPPRICYPRRIRSYSSLIQSSSTPITLPKAPTSCPTLLDLTKCTPTTQRSFLPRKTASAPSITEDETLKEEDEEQVNRKISPSAKDATIKPVTDDSTTTNATSVAVKPSAGKSTAQHKISPPAYLSPQPSRLLRQVRQASNSSGGNKARPTSVSVTSIDHEFQKTSKLGGVPPWARQSTTDLPPTPQVHVSPLPVLKL